MKKQKKAVNKYIEDIARSAGDPSSLMLTVINTYNVMCNLKLIPKDPNPYEAYIGADKFNLEVFITDIDVKIKTTQDRWDSFKVQAK